MAFLNEAKLVSGMDRSSSCCSSSLCLLSCSSLSLLSPSAFFSAVTGGRRTTRVSKRTPSSNSSCRRLQCCTSSRAVSRSALIARIASNSFSRDLILSSNAPSLSWPLAMADLVCANRSVDMASIHLWAVSSFGASRTTRRRSLSLIALAFLSSASPPSPP